MSIKNNKFSKIFIIFTLFLLISAGITFVVYFINLKTAPKKFETAIKNITANTKLIDANTDHNQALDVSEYAKKQGLEIPEILINFDTHSDIYLNYPVIEHGEAGVENWINELIAKNPKLNEIYWVMPFEEANNSSLQTLFSEHNLKSVKNGIPLYGNCLDEKLDYFTFVFKPLYIKEFRQNFLIEPKSGQLNEYIENSLLNDIFFDKSKTYKKVKIITCTKQTLPDFKNRKVFLSIDADYVSNSGFDTAEDFKIVKTPEQVTKNFYSIFNTIDKKNIRPEVISLSLSPQYLPQEHHKHVQQIFNYIIKTAGMKDPISIYKRKYDTDPDYLKKKYGNTGN